MAVGDRYKVVIGMSVTKEDGNQEFSDFGIVYSRMQYDKMVEVEQAFAKHSDEVNAGIKGLVNELVQMGVTEAAKRSGEAQSTPKSGPKR